MSDIQRAAGRGDLNKPFSRERKIQEADCAGRETKADALLGRHGEPNLDEASTGCFVGKQLTQQHVEKDAQSRGWWGGRGDKRGSGWGVEGKGGRGDPRLRKMKRRPSSFFLQLAILNFTARSLQDPRVWAPESNRDHVAFPLQSQ